MTKTISLTIEREYWEGECEAMSGGHFGSIRETIDNFAEELQEEIDRNRIKDEWHDSVDASDAAIDLLKKAKMHFEKSAKMAKHIDYFYSGDIGEEALIERLKEMLD